MMSDRRIILCAAFLFYMCVGSVAHAQDRSVAPYDERLNRLAEVLGSIHYLTNLCDEPTNRWRNRMQTMLSTEAPEPNRRARLIARFNRGYRTFNSVYTQCTPQAMQASVRYVDEGIVLADEINARYAQ